MKINKILFVRLGRFSLRDVWLCGWRMGSANLSERDGYNVLMSVFQHPLAVGIPAVF